LGQAVGYCSPYFGSGCSLLFQWFWIRLTNNLIQNNRNSNQQPDPK
jgi:hypothetical protein